jgi:outer membrane lipoprotein SlyB
MTNVNSFTGCESLKTLTKHKRNSNGAAGGAIIGGILGNNVGKGGNGAIGAVLGGVVGGVAGGVMYKMDKQTRQIDEVLQMQKVKRVGGNSISIE